MKRILTLVLMAGAFYFSSCTKDEVPVTNPVVIPKTDSTTKGGFLQISFAGKMFYFNDLNVKGVPVYSLYANTMSFDHNDTLFISQIQMTDHESQNHVA